MITSNRTLRTLRAGGAESCVWLAMGSAAIAECAVDAGARSVVLDLQHGLWDRISLESVIGLVAGSATALVRVRENSPYEIASALDAGAHGILVPMIGSAAEAAAAVAAAHYPPRGCRSAGGVRPLRDMAAYRRLAETEILTGIMIETVAAAEDADAIVRIPGIDLVFIGIGDLAISLEASGRSSLTIQSLIDNVTAAATRHAVPFGIFTSTAQDARARIAQGFQFVVAENDISMARNGFAKSLLVASGEPGVEK